MNDTITQIRQMLAEQGLPMTTENLNRAMLAISRNQPMEAGGGGGMAAVERTIARTTQPRRQQQPRPTGAAPAQEPEPDAPRQPAGPMSPQEQAQFTEANAAPAVGTTRGAQISSGAQPGGRRAGTINGATRIDESDPTAGMYAGTPGRQADETGVDQTELALAMLSPFAALGAMPATGARGMGNLGVTLAPRGALPAPSAGAGGTALPGAGAPVASGASGMPPGGGGAAIAAPARQLASPVQPLSPMQQAIARGPGRQADTLAEGARQRMSPVRDTMINRARSSNAKPRTRTMPNEDGTIGNYR